MTSNLETEMLNPRRGPGFWRGIAAAFVGIAIGNMGLVLALQAGALLPSAFMASISILAGAAMALLAPWVVCRVNGVGPDVRRALLRSFAAAAIPFGLALCASEEMLRIYGRPPQDLSQWQRVLWQYDRAIARALLAAAFVLAAAVFWRGRRPASRFRVIVVTGIGASLAWVGSEWMHVHRPWQMSPAAVPMIWGFLNRTMLSASAHVFFAISIGIAAMLMVREWPAYASGVPRGTFVRNLALGIALVSFAGLAILRPMVQAPRRVMTLLNVIRWTGSLDSTQKAELLQFGPPAIVELTKLAENGSAPPAGRVCAVNILAEVEGPEATDSLLRLLHDTLPDVRTRAFKALQKRAPQELEYELVQMLKDPYAEYRLFAATEIGALARKPAPTALVLLLNDESWHIRRNAVWALGAIGDTSYLPALTVALTDKEKSVRAAAATALLRMNDKSAIPALRDALNDESERVHYLAAEALGHLGDPEVVPVLLEALEKGCGLTPSNVSISIRKMAEALGECADASVLPSLHSLYRRTSGQNQRDIAYAIDIVRDREMERTMAREGKTKK